MTNDPVSAVRAYVSMSKSGWPTDRWVTGVDGCKALAAGCEQLLQERQELADACAAMLAEIEDRDARTVENMGVIGRAE